MHLIPPDHSPSRSWQPFYFPRVCGLLPTCASCGLHRSRIEEERESGRVGVGERRAARVRGFVGVTADEVVGPRGPRAGRRRRGRGTPPTRSDEIAPRCRIALAECRGPGRLETGHPLKQTARLAPLVAGWGCTLADALRQSGGYLPPPRLPLYPVLPPGGLGHAPRACPEGAHAARGGLGSGMRERVEHRGLETKSDSRSRADRSLKGARKATPHLRVPSAPALLIPPPLSSVRVRSARSPFRADPGRGFAAASTWARGEPPSTARASRLGRAIRPSTRLQRVGTVAFG